MVEDKNPCLGDKWRIPDALWERIEPLLPPQGPKPKGGRPRASARQCMDGIFYVLRTGCQWKALPRCRAPASTVHDRFQEWRQAGVFEKLWQAGLIEYDRRVGLDWEWQAMDGAMTKAPLGGKRNRSQSYRPGQRRDQTEPADGGPWDSHRGSGGWSQPA
jgi:putative transposase